MNINEIEKLVEKFYNGETTLSEERMLHGFFSGDSLPAHLKYMKRQFAFYDNERGTGLEIPNYNDKVLESLDNKNKILKFKLHKPAIYSAYSVAVIIIIAIAINIFNFLNQRNPNEINQSTINDPEIAYRETKQALILVSTYVDEALTECRDISKFDEYRQMIFYK